MKALDAEHYLIEAVLDRDRVESFATYPFNLPIVKQFDRLEFHPQVTFLVGENGSGKSTLLEALAVGMGFNAEGGSKNFHFATRDSHSSLHQVLRLTRGIKRPRDGFFLRAESFFNVATEIENLDKEPGMGAPISSHYGDKSLHEQSHGESFMSLMLNRFGGQGLYLLDEPEAALSPSRQLAMLARIHELVEDRSQLVIATHSPIILAYPNAIIYELNDGQLRSVAYKDTSQYRLTREFLDNPETYLRHLLGS